MPQDQPHPHIKKQYGAKVQHAKPPDNTPLLDKAGKKFIQEVTGVSLYLARAVDSTTLTPLSALASKQAAPTEKMMQDCLQFLDFAASQEDTIVTYQASDMKFAIHSNAPYLSEPKARSRASGHMFMAGTEEITINNLSRKCRHFRVRQKLLLKTSVRVFPTRWPDTRTCRRHHAMLGFFLCVVFCVVSSIADMSIQAVEMS